MLTKNTNPPRSSLLAQVALTVLVAAAIGNALGRHVDAAALATFRTQNLIVDTSSTLNGSTTVTGTASFTGATTTIGNADTDALAIVATPTFDEQPVWTEGSISPSKQWEVYEEFAGCGGSTSVGDWVYFSSGTGATVSNTDGTANHPTQCRLLTGTTTTGRASASYTNDATGKGILFGGGPLALEVVLQPRTLCDSVTNVCTIRCGFIDSVVGESTDGAFFKFDPAASANWRIVTANNSTLTEQDSSPAVAVADTTWVKLGISVNAAATSVSYTINGAAAGSIATNIPTGAGRTTSLGCLILKSAGTTTREVWLDYLHARQTFTTPR